MAMRSADQLNILRESGELDTSGEKKVRTEGLWVKCENCRQIIWKKDLEENMNVCPKCDKHFRIDARTRLAQLLDDNQYATFDGDLSSTDPLKFVDLKPYWSRLKQAQKDTGLKDAVINAHSADAHAIMGPLKRLGVRTLAHLHLVDRDRYGDDDE